MDDRLKKQINNIEPDIQHYIFEKGFKSGQEHNHSSKETVERIDSLKIELNTFKIFMDNITNTIRDIHQEMKEGFKLNSDEHKEILDKKADKEVVDQIRADIRKVVWIIIGGVMASILALVLK